MKRLPILALLPLAALARAGTATFDDLAYSGTLPYENGAHLSPPGLFASGGVSFANAYDGYWSGFAYSKVQDATTAGYGNQYAASPGAAFSGSSYGVSFGDGAALTLGAGQRILGMRVTNTTYAALSMLNGDPFAKRFGGATGDDPDFFRLTATGYANGLVTGAATFALADYTFADRAQDYVVRDWRDWDLSGLGAATSVRFTYASSDVGQFGINTPTYFALDDVRTQAVPEPASLAALALGLAAIRRRRR